MHEVRLTVSPSGLLDWESCKKPSADADGNRCVALRASEAHCSARNSPPLLAASERRKLSVAPPTEIPMVLMLRCRQRLR
jgi:hypothetical protein